MNNELATYQTFDPQGIRRVIARLLDIDHPDSLAEAEKLIATRLGPYNLDRGVMSEEIATYFQTRH